MATKSGQRITSDSTSELQRREERLFTPPASPIPLYISTMAPGSATFAGTYGDGMIAVGGQEPDLYRQILQSFEEGVRATGRNPAGMPRLIELNVAYTADKETAIAQHQKYWAGSFIPALYNQKIYTPKLSEQNGKVVDSDTIERMVCISDQADEHVRYAQRYLDLGFDHLIFHSAGPDQRAFIERYGHDVLPRLHRPA